MSKSLSAAGITTLENGLRVVTRRMPGRASAALGLWVATGSRFESEEENGSAHFIEHMLFKGTKRRSPREISEAVEGLGGYLNAFTGEESTCYYARARQDHLGTLFDVLSDMVLNSKFDPDDFQKEREVIKEEVSMYLDQPQHHVQELLNEATWPGHPLGRPLAGTHETLDALSRESLLKFQGKSYTTGSILISAAGNVEHAEVVKQVRKIARFFRNAPSLECVPAPTAHSGPALRFLKKRTEQCQLALGYGSFPRHDPRRYALKLLSVILGENMSSRLFQSIREERGLAYAISSSVSSYADTGTFEISAGLDESNLDKALALALEELGRICTRPIPAAELRRARDYAIGQFELSLESTENQMNWIAEQTLAFGRPQIESEAVSNFMKVTAAEIRQVAREIFQPNRASLAVISPGKESPRLKKLLAKPLF